MNKYVMAFVAMLGLLLAVSCNNQREYLSHDLQEKMSLKRVINDTLGQQVLYVTDATPRARKNRSYYWYRNGRVRYTRGNYSGRLLNGEYEQFDTNQLLEHKGRYKKGTRTGRWQQWYANGNLQFLKHFDSKGRLHGTFEEYTSQKQLVKKGIFRRGKKQSKWIEQNDTIIYKKGKVFVKDTSKPSLFQRVFKKKANGQEKAPNAAKKKTKKEPNFFQRLFQKKTKKERKTS